MDELSRILQLAGLTEALEVPPQPEHVLAPDVGAKFEYNGAAYIVSAWIKEAPARDTSWLNSDEDVPDDWMGDILYQSQQEIGPRKQRLVFTQRKDATYVAGRGVAGCVAPVDMIKVTGRANISQEHYNNLVRNATRLVGQPIY
jgi:hypothetical protein